MGLQDGADGDGCRSSQLGPTRILLRIIRRFIIDGVITLPIALYGFLIFPDVPANTKAFYLTEEVSFTAA